MNETPRYMSNFLTLIPLEFAKWSASGKNVWTKLVNSGQKTDQEHQNGWTCPPHEFLLLLLKRQGRGSKIQDQDRESIIGITRKKMGINIKHSISYIKTSIVTFCDFADNILRCSGLMGDIFCHWKKKKILTDLSFPWSIEFKRQCISGKTIRGVFMCAFWIPVLPGWLCSHKAAYFDM